MLRNAEEKSKVWVEPDVEGEGEGGVDFFTLMGFIGMTASHATLPKHLQKTINNATVIKQVYN